MGTVSRLPEKVRIIVPTIESEAEAFDGVHTLIRQLSTTKDALAANVRSSCPLPAIAASGLLGITVPPEQGGADVSNIVLGEIILSLASANRMAAALLASHFHSIELLRGCNATGPSDYFYKQALAGDLFLMIGNIDDTADFGNLRLTPETGKPGWRLNGSVKSAIDPIHADWIVIHNTSDDRTEHAVFIPRLTAGLRLTAEGIGFSNVHVDADCFVSLTDHAVATAGPLDNLLQSAQKLGWAERELEDRVALHARPSTPRRAVDAEYLSALGLTVSRIENGKAALERAGRKIDNAQVNGDAETVRDATFSAAIALSSAAEAFDLASEIEVDHRHSAWGRMDPYGHAPIGARLLENSLH